MLDRMMADSGFPGPVAESEGCRVFQFHSETGEGSMTQYDLFPGVYLMYNDFHMEAMTPHFTPRKICCASTTAARAGWSTRRGRIPTPMWRPGT